MGKRHSEALAGNEGIWLPGTGFYQSGDWVRVNLYRNQDLATNQETSQETNKTNQETNQKPSDTGHEISQKEESATVLTNADRIRKAIAENPSVTQKELQELTGLFRSGGRYILQQMRDTGKLERIGSTKNGNWILKDGSTAKQS